jgi:hypothetical protein
VRALKEISVGNGWYWLAGVAIALVGTWAYFAIVSPILPALAWHVTHSRKMQFAAFSLDVPLLWSVPKADYQQPNDISIDEATYVIFPRHFSGSIVLSKSRSGSCIGCFDREREMWARMYGASDTTPITYRLASGEMACLYHEISPSFVTMTCVNEKTGSGLEFLGSKQDYLKLHDIVH